MTDQDGTTDAVVTPASSFSPHHQDNSAQRHEQMGEAVATDAAGTPASSSLPPLQRETSKGAVTKEEAIVGDEGEKPVRSTLAQTRLSLTNKKRIIELYATFHTLSDIQAIFFSETGVHLPKQQVHSYDVSKPSCRAGPTLRAHYTEMRKAYTDRAVDVAIAHQAHRLRQLESIVNKATKSKDYTAALKGIELAAKEMGGLTQTVRHEGVVGHMHRHQHSVEDAKAEVSMRLTQLLESGALLPTSLLPAPIDADVISPTP